MTNVLALLAFLFPAPDMTGPVAVHAAYVIHTRPAETQTCCGSCQNGWVVHGDGHKTPCPCPPDCLCKAVRHPPVILHSDGKCESKP
jgi:hypothetical protein